MQTYSDVEEALTGESAHATYMLKLNKCPNCEDDLTEGFCLDCKRRWKFGNQDDESMELPRR